jgi:hypothetical protein
MGMLRKLKIVEKRKRIGFWQEIRGREEHMK